MRILGVHGIHNLSWSKDSFTDKMLGALSYYGHDGVDVPGRLMTALLAYSDWAIERRADEILTLHQKGDCLLAHSFGGLASHAAMRKGAKFSVVIFFGAAAECNLRFPKGAFEVLYNVHSNTDRALALGKRLPFGHKFGGLGYDGYTGRDKRIINVPAHGLDHNDYANKPDQLVRWAAWADAALRGKALKPVKRAA
jgi:hypothetical protein